VSKVYPFITIDEVMEDDFNNVAMEVGLDKIISKNNFPLAKTA
jgi:hypothetical protein